MRFSTVVRVTLAFLYGVMLGVLWECASMGVLLLATVIEHFCGTFVMAVIFVGSAAFAVSVAARADLAPPLFSILAFRLSAQIAMTIGTGSVNRRPPRQRTLITRRHPARSPFPHPSLTRHPCARPRRSSCSRRF